MTALSFDDLGKTVIKPSVLAHIVLRTQPKKFRQMVDFYKTILGAHASYETDVFSFLTYDHEHHRIAIAGIPGTLEKVPKSSGLAHVAFTFKNLRELLLSYRQRKANGIEPHWTTNHGVTISMYYHDPDGNDVEMQVDVFATPDEATQYMLSPAFAMNPIGVDFDPEDYIKRLEAGEEEKSIMKRPDVPLTKDINEL